MSDYTKTRENRCNLKLLTYGTNKGKVAPVLN
jgi:hypothetical protein